MTNKYELNITHQYLNFPIKDGAAKQKVRFRAGDQVVHYFDIEWAVGEPDYWMFTDVAAFQDEMLVIEVEGSEKLAALKHSDMIEGGEELYRERFRPKLKSAK